MKNYEIKLIGSIFNDFHEKHGQSILKLKHSYQLILSTITTYIYLHISLLCFICPVGLLQRLNRYINNGKVIKSFPGFMESVTFLVKSGLKLNSEQYENHRKPFFEYFGCKSTWGCNVLLAAFWAVWLSTSDRVPLFRIIE